VPSLQEGKVPNFQKTQTEMADANRLPSRRIVPALKPGKVPGTVDIELKVSDSLPLHASAELNNDHGPNTAALRTVATVHYDDLWELGHSISGTALIAPERPGDSKVFAGSYLAPIWGSPWSMLLYGYTSNSDVTAIGGLGVLGKGYAVGVRAIRQLPQWGNYSQSLNFGIDFKHFKQDLSLGGAGVTAAVDYWPLSASYSLQGEDNGSQVNINLAATLGLRGIGSGVATFNNNRAFASPDFIHVNLDTDLLYNLGSDIFADVRFSGQLSDGPLLSGEQFAAGGLQSVRGYLQSEAVGDDGVFGSLELRSPSIAPYLFNFVDEWRFYGFADNAAVWLHKPLAGQQDTFTLLSAGGGTRFSLFNHFTADALIGVPLRSGTVRKANHPYAAFRVKTEF
jgi:hemolysin activation/secretion protein